MLGGAGLVLLLDRGRLVIAIAGGSVVVGVAAVVPGVWPHPVDAYRAGSRSGSASSSSRWRRKR